MEIVFLVIAIVILIFICTIGNHAEVRFILLMPLALAFILKSESQSKYINSYTIPDAKEVMYIGTVPSKDISNLNNTLCIGDFNCMPANGALLVDPLEKLFSTEEFNEEFFLMIEQITDGDYCYQYLTSKRALIVNNFIYTKYVELKLKETAIMLSRCALDTN